MRNNLRLGLLGIHIPHRARRVNTRSPQQGRVIFVPIERRQGCTILAVLVIIQQCLQLGALWSDIPYPQVVPRGGQEVPLRGCL